MFLSREIDIYIRFGIRFKILSFKQMIFSKYATNLKMTISEEPEKLMYAAIII